jgi:hypothetical protein
MEALMHDAGDTSKALGFPGIRNLLLGGGETGGALQDGLQGDAVSRDGFLDDGDDLAVCCKKGFQNGLEGVQTLKFELFGAEVNCSFIFSSELNFVTIIFL